MSDSPEADGLKSAREAGSLARFASLVLDLDACTLMRESGDAIALTRGEFALLRVFIAHPGRVISRDTLLGALANRRFEPYDRSVDVLIGRLRRKIEPDPKQPRLIVTVPGQGYRFDGLTKTSSPAPKSSTAVTGRPEQDPETPAPSKGGAESILAAADAILAPSVTPTDQAKSPSSKQRWGSAPLLAAGIAALLIVIAGGAWWFLNLYRPATIAANAPTPVASNAPPPLAAQRLSIVVLPFANLSGDPAQDYLADALTDELTTALSRIRDSFVIARNSALTFKGKPVDAKAIGKDLGVRYLLEGSVQRSGDQVRIDAQLIDADSGAHVWADQFDTPRADLLQMQDEIVTRAMDVQLPEAEAARLKRTPAANPNAEDLALQCQAGARKGGHIGKEADEGYRLCEQALAADPNNVRALSLLSLKFFLPVAFCCSADPKTDLERADELASKALALDPSYARAHTIKAGIVSLQGRHDEAIAENERALALDPALLYAVAGLSWDYLYRGEFEKSLEFSDKAIRLSPHDPSLEDWYRARMAANFGLKRYDLAIDWARRAIAIKADNLWAYLNLIAALALTGREVEAHQALRNYLALVPGGPRTIAAWKAIAPPFTYAHSDPRFLDEWNRSIEGLRKVGMPEE
jgi:TolB-like protein/DNA-binding winged helix-turn-helix (wHTH) protein/Flp pilus assembly protein TadD